MPDEADLALSANQYGAVAVAALGWLQQFVSSKGKKNTETAKDPVLEAVLTGWGLEAGEAKGKEKQD